MNLTASVKKIIGIVIVLAIVVAGIYIWRAFNQKHGDTAAEKADYTLNAMDLMHEFQKNDSLANKKYAEKIIVVNGRVFEKVATDSTVNIKISDTTSGSYIIFDFQAAHMADARNIKEGDSVSIKGSCSGGTYSQILDAESINFKRCALNK